MVVKKIIYFLGSIFLLLIVLAAFSLLLTLFIDMQILGQDEGAYNFTQLGQRIAIFSIKTPIYLAGIVFFAIKSERKVFLMTLKYLSIGAVVLYAYDFYVELLAFNLLAYLGLSFSYMIKTIISAVVVLVFIIKYVQKFQKAITEAPTGENHGV